MGSKAEFRARAVRCVEGPAPVGLAGGGRWRVRPDGAGASPSGVFATHLAHSFGRGETTQGRCVAEAAGGANSPASADRSPKLDSWFPLKKRPPPVGVPAVGQWDWRRLGSAGTKVQSPAWHSGLRILCCCSFGITQNRSSGLGPWPRAAKKRRDTFPSQGTQRPCAHAQEETEAQKGRNPPRRPREP